MKQMIASIRTDSNTHRSKVNELNNEIDKVLLKYVSGKLGYKEMNKQISRLNKPKLAITAEISKNIKQLEQIERDIKDGVKINHPKIVQLK